VVHDRQVRGVRRSPDRLEIGIVEGKILGSSGHTAATHASPASFSIARALAAGSVAGARTMLFNRRGSAAQYSAM